MAQLSTSVVGGNNGEAGSGILQTVCTVQFERFILGTYNSVSNTQTIQFVTSIQTSISGSWFNSSASGFVKFWVNVANPTGINITTGIETQTSGNPTYTQSSAGTFNYTFSGRINSIAVFMRGIFLDLTTNTERQVNFYSGNMTFINSTSDFNFIDATPSTAKLIKLPPVTAESSGNLYFYKIKGLKGRNVYIYTYDDSVFADYNQSGIVLKDDYACATVFNDGIKWYIANYYPSQLQGVLPTSTTNSFAPDKITAASRDTINIFNTTGSAPRQSGDNLCNLPEFRGDTAMCIVVYSGNVNRGGGNALLFSHSRNIDNNPNYNRTTRPYIYANETSKSNGVVFIGDGTTWYIAGWFFGSNWETSTSTYTGYTNTSLGSLDSHTIRTISGTGAGTVYILPQDVPSETPHVLIVKARSDAQMMRFNAGSAFISDNLRGINYNITQSNICIWFVRQLIGGVVKYYPIIGYTPGI